jgi:transcriptional regulator
MNEKSPLLQGSLDLLVLRALKVKSMHGYGIARHLHAASESFLQVEEGSLYPALHRLERRGWIASKWGVSESNRRAKYYRLTAQGRKQLEKETASWSKMAEAINRVLNHKSAEA